MDNVTSHIIIIRIGLYVDCHRRNSSTSEKHPNNKNSRIDTGISTTGSFGALLWHDTLLACPSPPLCMGATSPSPQLACAMLDDYCSSPLPRRNAVSMSVPHFFPACRCSFLKNLLLSPFLTLTFLFCSMYAISWPPDRSPSIPAVRLAVALPFFGLRPIVPE